MKRKYLAVGIILLFIGTAILPSSGQKIEMLSQPTSRDHWLYVGGTGPGNYSKIMDAIRNTSDGDTVFVYAHSSPYYENVLISHSINFIGEDKNTTIIDGQLIHSVLSLAADNCYVSGFSLFNCSPSYPMFQRAVIKVYSNGNIIENNIISSGDVQYSEEWGTIDLVQSSYNKIIHNRIFDNYWGCDAIVIDDGSSNIISENDITSHQCGIYVSGGFNNVISGNIIHGNRIGVENSGQYSRRFSTIPYAIMFMELIVM